MENSCIASPQWQFQSHISNVTSPFSYASHEKIDRASSFIRDYLNDKVIHCSDQIACEDCIPYLNAMVESSYSDLQSSILKYKIALKDDPELAKEDKTMKGAYSSSNLNSPSHKRPFLPSRPIISKDFEDMNELLSHICSLDYEVDSVTAKLESTTRVLKATLSELEEGGKSYNHLLQAPDIFCNECNTSDPENILSNHVGSKLSEETTHQLFARVGNAGRFLRLSFSAVSSINLGWSEVNGAWVNMACLMLNLRRSNLLPAELTFHFHQKESNHTDNNPEEVATVHVLPLSGRVQLTMSTSGVESSVQYLCLQGGVLKDRQRFETSGDIASATVSVSESLYLRAVLLFAAGVVQTSFDINLHGANITVPPNREVSGLLCSSCEHFQRHCQQEIRSDAGNSSVSTAADLHTCSSCGCRDHRPNTRRIARELIHALNPDDAGMANGCKCATGGAAADLIDSLWFGAGGCTVTLPEMEILLLDMSCILKSLSLCSGGCLEGQRRGNIIRCTSQESSGCQFPYAL